jgi:hypothetical protein
MIDWPIRTHILATALNSTNEALIEAGRHWVHQAIGYNNNAALRYLKLYDKATAPIVGTDIPKLLIPLPPTTAFSVLIRALEFERGVGFALTTGQAHADTGAVGADDIRGLSILFR